MEWGVWRGIGVEGGKVVESRGGIDVCSICQPREGDCSAKWQGVKDLRERPLRSRGVLVHLATSRVLVTKGAGRFGLSMTEGGWRKRGRW